MYLYLAIFWLVVGVIAQFFWDTLQEHAYIPVDRTVFGIIFFVLFSYNFLRWRMARMMHQSFDDTVEPPPRPKVVHREYDPSLDFSKPDPDGDPPTKEQPDR